MKTIHWIAAALAAIALGGPIAASAGEPAPAPAAQAAGSTDAIEVEVKGMACPFCAYGIEKKLRAIPGARRAKVDLEGGRARFEAPAGSVTEQQVKQAIKDAGFTVGKIEIKHVQ